MQCDECEGKGTVETFTRHAWDDTGWSGTRGEAPCDECDGTGNAKCQHCGELLKDGNWDGDYEKDRLTCSDCRTCIAEYIREARHDR